MKKYMVISYVLSDTKNEMVMSGYVLASVSAFHFGVSVMCLLVDLCGMIMI